MSIVDDVPTEAFSGVMLQHRSGRQEMEESLRPPQSRNTLPIRYKLVFDSKAPWS
jgi:hypothetical protein